MTAVLVLGDLPASLEITRSLGQMGHTIIVGTSSLSCYANLSRYCSETWYHPSIRESSPSFFQALKQFLNNRPEIKFIFPAEDIYLVEFAGRHAQLPKAIKLVMPSKEHIQLCDDKLAMHELVDFLNIPQAAYTTAIGKAGLFKKCNKIGYPCVLLHVDSHQVFLGQKAIIINSRSDLEQTFERRPDFDEKVLIRAFAQGKRFNYNFVASEGKILNGVQIKTLRTDRYDGTGSGIEGQLCDSLPDITRHTEKLLAHMKYNGPGMTQFLIDEDSEAVTFLEMNPRLTQGCVVASRAGLDLVRTAFEIADGALERNVSAQSRLRKNIRYAWLSASLKAIRHEWRNRKINPLQAIRWYINSVSTALRADAHIIWRLDDPIPAIFALCPNLLFSFRKRYDKRTKNVLPT